MTQHVIVRSTDLARLESLTRRVLDQGGAVHADLPLISSRALDVSDTALQVLDGFEWAPDGEVETIPEVRGTSRGAPAAGPTIHAPEMWNAGYEGTGVNVAIVDTGVSNHKDFQGRIVAFKDLVNNKTKPYDDNGHGTHVAGIVAGDGTDSKGKYKGVAPKAGIVAIKAFDSEGKGRVSDVIQGIQWAVDQKDTLGIKVLNLSARGKAEMSYKNDPLSRAAEAAWAKGLVCVVAVGNDGPDDHTIGSPANAQNVISVGATDDRGTAERKDDRIYGNSGRGPTPVDELSKPDVVAPGVNIKSTTNSTGGYEIMTGTSMASPMVAGMAALLVQAHPGKSNDQIKTSLTGTAEKLPKAGGLHDQGFGLIDGWLAHQSLN